MIKTTTVEEYIAKSNPEFRELAQKLREIIIQAVPNIEEHIKWSMPRYSVDGKNVCYFCITKHHVGLGFYEGKHLFDPRHLLQGEGKKVRQANFTKKQVLHKKIVIQWVRESALSNLR